MKKIVLLVISVCFGSLLCFSQIEKSTYTLLSANGDLSEEMKALIQKNVENKRFVFLGESFHKSGADLIYKTKFVKYLVDELGYRDVIFESDFYGLYIDKDKQNIHNVWSRADQCSELFEFIDNENLELWGIDSNLHSPFSKKNFAKNLKQNLDDLNSSYSLQFIETTAKIIEFGFKTRTTLQASELDSFINELDNLIQTTDFSKNSFLLQSLKNIKTSTLVYTAKNDRIGIAERDRQMADNLQYLADRFPDKKFIIWAANAHITKTENKYMGGATLGSRFVESNPDNSYHIAFASIKMPYRQLDKIQKEAKSDKNLIYYLPDLEQDYFIDCKKAVAENPDLTQEVYYANLWSGAKKHLKTKWLEHFDAIVYIENGALTSYKNLNSE
ncbi:erythromycin esterase family protein [Leeuwenhoekiella sp. H156]|uniref:erythromycin esterase family protein n=1 Tax=Leeuwenhoekiella sp. H156 TaxID=3450128 RepID=UPI003FA4538B